MPVAEWLGNRTGRHGQAPPQAGLAVRSLPTVEDTAEWVVAGSRIAEWSVVEWLVASCRVAE